MKVSLIAVTQPLIRLLPGSSTDRPLTPEELIVYAARVSNPSNQLNVETGARLLRYCLKNKHWSIFETVSMTVEIQTSRAIAAQILRHRSFTFQEFSQRYAAASNYEFPQFRMKGSTNRQGSTEQLASEELEKAGLDAVVRAFDVYNDMIEKGVAPESARMILPLCTQTTLYMTGSVRSWIHYLEQRTSPHAQKEHRLVALQIQEIFNQQFPETAEAMKGDA